MLFSQDEIQQLLDLIDQNTNVFIAKNLGNSYLSEDEIKKLTKSGIDTLKIYSDKFDLIKQSFYFGLISDSLGKDNQKITFKDLQKHFSSGKHIPLSTKENYAVDSIKKQFLGDIKSNKNKIFQDVNNIISSNEKNNRVAYEDVIRDAVKTKIIDNKTVGEIARELGKITGDWNRNFTKSIEYISHYALNEGRIASLERKDPEGKVYFDVYSGACKMCIQLYLTKGIGSKPKIFTISQLKQNGTNIGRKQKDWKATLSPTHVFCRCTINVYREGSVWDKEKERFELPKTLKIENRKPIKFIVNISGEDKEYYV